VDECTFSYHSQNVSGESFSGSVTREDTQRTPFAIFEPRSKLLSLITAKRESWYSMYHMAMHCRQSELMQHSPGRGVCRLWAADEEVVSRTFSAQLPGILNESKAQSTKPNAVVGALKTQVDTCNSTRIKMHSTSSSTIIITPLSPAISICIFVEPQCALRSKCQASYSPANRIQVIKVTSTLCGPTEQYVYSTLPREPAMSGCVPQMVVSPNHANRRLKEKIRSMQDAI
jgi:hypothetical protein